ncbi:MULTISPECIES: acetyl-CoA hydrolase/transferase C-terminal domain-containing protein [Lysobacter]|uniref:acetyl-CoA hydrolase/transferase C-terminal domain-containing protein n=1 Tax=Lysobacter TaxID=68 RepID=UPI001F402F23|nr:MULTISPECIES: acetyl-CoA hydrolase/transferase C-terminal domain-containing protein [Lysobacter]UJB18166.1 acetyl-CoA hydrolase [Lysobacter capsici]UJQ28111.1 acetyl-CoA hydrolase [Lysobacter gummosus]
MNPPLHFDSLADAIDFLYQRLPGALHVGAPLGLGKPHRLLNALYERAERETQRPLRLYTALSLDPPGAGKGLEGRFIGPFAQRHFGDDFPRLRYVQALKRNALPEHIEIEEFYLQSGSLLNASATQRRYASLNYTHVARALADRGVNAIVQKVAADPAGGTRLSLSCNTDLTFDAVDAIVARGLPRPLLIAEVDPQLPWLGGSAAVEASFFDAVVTPPGPHPKLFGLPRQPVSDADYAIGFYASTLVRDGGTLQIGIGTLADALCHALALRHTDNSAYLRVIEALGIGDAASVEGNLSGDRNVMAPGERFVGTALGEGDLTGHRNAKAQDDRFVGTASGEGDLTGHRNAKAQDDRFVGAASGEGDLTGHRNAKAQDGRFVGTALGEGDLTGHRNAKAQVAPLGSFQAGLFGCSEMINEGFRRLVEVGVIKRKVVDDLELMRRLHDGTSGAEDLQRLDREGEFLQGGFYLGSPDFYDWLRHMPADQQRGVSMRRISEVNELYGGNETLERLQRRDARFFNSCMMATALGAAVSDTLDDGRVVSGVGGQYNFVAMAHALPDARSVLMLRASRDSAGEVRPNVVWNYAQTTIPRHLRDIYITEYGIADLRGKTDEDCVLAMTAVADSRHQFGLMKTAMDHGKLKLFQPRLSGRNTPERLRAALAPFRREGVLPDYPLGSDFTEVEQRLVKALGWLKANTATRGAKIRTVLRALFSPASDDREALQRMGLEAPSGFGERVEAKLVGLGLRSASE